MLLPFVYVDFEHSWGLDWSFQLKKLFSPIPWPRISISEKQCTPSRSCWPAWTKLCDHTHTLYIHTHTAHAHHSNLSIFLRLVCRPVDGCQNYSMVGISVKNAWARVSGSSRRLTDLGKPIGKWCWAILVVDSSCIFFATSMTCWPSSFESFSLSFWRFRSNSADFFASPVCFSLCAFKERLVTRTFSLIVSLVSSKPSPSDVSSFDGDGADA